MASKRPNNQNLALADALEIWSQKNQVQDDPYVSSLVGALKSGLGLQSLSQYDATEILPFPESPAGVKQSSLAENLISLRNILVFVPVAFTWAGISQATSAYSKYTLANPNTIVNFFDFWENGYGVLANFWTLSSITRIGFLLLTLIILGSIAIAVLQRQSTQLKELSQKEIAKERFEMGFEINQALFQHKSISPIALSQNTLGAIRDLRATSASIAKLSKNSERMGFELSRGSVIRQQLETIKKMIEKLEK